MGYSLGEEDICMACALLTITAVVPHTAHDIPKTALPAFPACQTHWGVHTFGIVTELIQSTVLILCAGVQLRDKKRRRSAWKPWTGELI